MHIPRPSSNIPADHEIPAPGLLRVSDLEREATATRIRDAVAEGRLTLDEAEHHQIPATVLQPGYA